MTDEQIAQRNRENAVHSTGPRTSKGRRRSSQNAYRNELNGQTVCSTPKELAAFKRFCAENGYRAHVNEIESDHPELDTALAASRTFLEQAHAISLISTYKGSLRRGAEQ